MRTHRRGGTDKKRRTSTNEDCRGGQGWADAGKQRRQRQAKRYRSCTPTRLFLEPDSCLQPLSCSIWKAITGTSWANRHFVDDLQGLSEEIVRYFDVSTGQTSYQTLFRVLHRHSLQANIFLLRNCQKARLAFFPHPPSTLSANCEPAPLSPIEPASRRTKESTPVAPTRNGIWRPNFVCTTYPVEPGTRSAICTLGHSSFLDSEIWASELTPDFDCGKKRLADHCKNA